MSTTPVNVQIPSSPDAPVLADFSEHAIRAAYVNRAHLKALPNAWNATGVYVLLTDDGTGRIYVGKAIDLRKRLQNHSNREKLPWTRAIAMKRDTTHGFNSAEIGYLEGRLAAEVEAVAGLTVVKGKTDSDTTLPLHMMLSLDALIVSMLAAIRLAGIDIARDDGDDGPDSEPTKVEQLQKSIPCAVTDLVSAGLLAAGETLHLAQGSVRAEGGVTADGAIVVDNVAYSSPSRAAAKALGLQSSNGWTTWHVGSLSGPTLDSLRSKWRAQAKDNND